jgi:hypothetical protein
MRYIEIADDLYAARQVEFFDDGHVLRYDRSRWCDSFGQLFACRFSHKPKAITSRRNAVEIDAAEFERAWRMAQHSTLVWAQQLASSRHAEWGDFR